MFLYMMALFSMSNRKMNFWLYMFVLPKAMLCSKQNPLEASRTQSLTTQERKMGVVREN